MRLHTFSHPTGRVKRGLLGLALVALVSTTGCALLAQAKVAAPPRSAASVAPPPNPETERSRANLGLPSIAEVAAAVRPAVVTITTRELTLDFFLQPVQQEGAGSGVIFDTAGHIITNNHVVENARNIQLTLPDGRIFDRVTVVGRDALTDLAVLKIQGSNLPVAKLGDSDQLRVGEWVIAIGNALGLEGGPTVTAGVVGALGRSIQEPNSAVLDDLIQTDAAINPGNSGGPLINLNGEIVGINTAIDTRGQGIGFAISINSARPIINQLVQSGRVVRAFLGIRAATMTANIAVQLRLPMTEGIFIEGVQPGGPAAQSGLQPRDIITKLDGRSIKNTRDLQGVLREKRLGDKLQVTLVRESREQTISVTLEETPGGR